ncbi:hypothetical protein, partial [Actinotignum sanguinis]
MKHPSYLAVAAAAATAIFIPTVALGAPATPNATTSNLSRMDADKDKVAQDKAAAEAELARVTADLAAEQAKIPQLEESLAAARQRLADQEAPLAPLLAQQQELTTACGKLDTAVASQEEKLAQLRTTLKEVQETEYATIDEKNALVVKRTKMQQAGADVTEISAQIDALEKKLEQLRTQQQQLNT